MIKEDKKEEAIIEIKKIYKIDKKDEVRQVNFIHDEIKKSLGDKGNKVDTCQAICGKKYRRASCNGLMILIFHTFTGVSGLYLFSTGIF